MAAGISRFRFPGKTGDEWIGGKVVQDAEGLASHLAAGFARLGGDFEGFEHSIEAEAGLQILCEGCFSGGEREHRVCGRGGVFQMRAEERRDVARRLHAAGLDQGFQAEGMGVASGGEESVGELQEMEEAR